MTIQSYLRRNDPKFYVIYNILYICMEIYAKNLSNKPVVDSNGSVIGELYNVTINFQSGELRNLLVNPEGDTTQQQRQRSKYSVDDHGRYMISVSDVTAVKDQIIVS